MKEKEELRTELQSLRAEAIYFGQRKGHRIVDTRSPEVENKAVNRRKKIHQYVVQRLHEKYSRAFWKWFIHIKHEIKRGYTYEIHPSTEKPIGAALIISIRKVFSSPESEYAIVTTISWD